MALGRSQDRILRALSTVLSFERPLQGTLLETGALPGLVALLRDSQADGAYAGAAALFNACALSGDARDAAVAAGAGRAAGKAAVGRQLVR